MISYLFFLLRKDAIIIISSQDKVKGTNAQNTSINCNGKMFMKNKQKKPTIAILNIRLIASALANPSTQRGGGILKSIMARIIRLLSIIRQKGQ